MCGAEVDRGSGSGISIVCGLQLVREVEAAMLEAETQMAVYLAHETQELLHIYESVRTATNTDSATSAAAGECCAVGGSGGGAYR